MSRKSEDSKDIYFYLEEMDYFGYYCPNTSNQNDFNYHGNNSKSQREDGSPYAQAWSMKEIFLPNGLKIRWEYETNKYDAVNNNTVAIKSNCGIRVKKVICSTRGSDITTEYSYTNDLSFLENINNCSGHLSVEPMPYLLMNSEGEDPELEIVVEEFILLVN